MFDIRTNWYIIITSIPTRNAVLPWLTNIDRPTVGAKTDSISITSIILFGCNKMY